MAVVLRMTATTLRLNANAPLPALVDALAAAAWGLLAPRDYHGVKAVLVALSTICNRRSASATTTIAQIADRAGRCTRRTADAVLWLEDLGFISYSRGQIWEGVPKAGFIRVHKAALVDLIRAARPAKDQTQADRAARLRDRMARRGRPTFRNRPEHLRRSRRMDITDHLPPLQGKDRAPSARSLSTNPSEKDIHVHASQYEPWLPRSCHHAPKDPYNCKGCRSMAIQAKNEERARRNGEDEISQALMREYAAAMYPGRPFRDVYRFVRSMWLAGDIHKWKAAQGTPTALFEVTNG